MIPLMDEEPREHWPVENAQDFARGRKLNGLNLAVFVGWVMIFVFLAFRKTLAREDANG